jgi:HSP20 family protein
MATDVTAWNPFADFAELRRSVDVVRRNGNLVLRADLPGIKPDEVTVAVENDVLTISAEQAEESKEEKDGHMRRERRYGLFSRSMSLPAGVEVGDIESSTEDGVLEVRIPLPEADQEKPVETKTKSKAS